MTTPIRAPSKDADYRVWTNQITERVNALEATVASLQTQLDSARARLDVLEKKK